MSKFISVVALLAFGAVAAELPPLAISAFEKGEKALAAGQFDQAEMAYKEALAAAPNYAAALNGLGSALFKQSKKDDAIAQFRAAIAADPSFKLGWFNLGYAARKTTDFKTAADAYEKYTALDSTDPDGFYGLGESHKALGNTAKAIAAYETYLQKEKRASEQKWIDKAKEAIATLKAPPPAPTPAPVAATPAPAQTAAVTPPPAAAQPAPVVAQPAPAVAATQNTKPAPDAPAMPAAGNRRVADGDKAMGEKKYRDAFFAYTDAVHADPGNVEALFKLGNANAVLGYYSQAIEQWTRVTQLATDASVKQKAQENITKAQAKMAQVGPTPQQGGQSPGSGPVAESSATTARYLYDQGVSLVIDKNFSKAADTLTDSIKLEPAVAKTYIARGSALIGMRRYAEAVLDYQYAIRLDPSLSSPLYGLGESYFGLNRPDEAKDYYQKFLASAAPDARTELKTAARARLEQLK